MFVYEYGVILLLAVEFHLLLRPVRKIPTCHNIVNINSMFSSMSLTRTAGAMLARPCHRVPNSYYGYIPLSTFSVL